MGTRGHHRQGNHSLSEAGLLQEPINVYEHMLLGTAAQSTVAGYREEVRRISERFSPETIVARTMNVYTTGRCASAATGCPGRAYKPQCPLSRGSRTDTLSPLKLPKAPTRSVPRHNSAPTSPQRCY